MGYIWHGWRTWEKLWPEAAKSKQEVHGRAERVGWMAKNSGRYVYVGYEYCRELQVSDRTLKWICSGLFSEWSDRMVVRGVHPPWGNDAFPSVSDFPIFPKNFAESAEHFPNLTFSQNIFRFSSAKISEDFISNYFHPISEIFFFSSLLLQNFLPDFVKCTCFYILYVYFVSPLLLPWCIYASHNARRLLDAPDGSDMTMLCVLVLTWVSGFWISCGRLNWAYSKLRM